MPIGEIFTGAFERIWQHKKLWLLAMLGLALSGLGTLVYSLLAGQWINGYFGFMNEMMRQLPGMPGEALGGLMGSMTWLWAAAGLAGLLGLIGYIINLVARGAIINEASHAWRLEATDTRRGLRRGLQRAVYVFLIDLVWWLPLIALVAAGAILFFLLIAGSVAASDTGGPGALIGWLWLFTICCAALIGLLYYLAWAIFSPLMYQAAVAGERDLGDALREGWGLARKHVGPMVIFWLLLALIGIVLSVVQQSIGAVFGLPLMSGWFRNMGDWMEGMNRGVVPAVPQMSTALFALVGVISAVLGFLVSSFMQALSLTLYAGVYQRLTRPGLAAPISPAPVSPAPQEPAPVVTVREDAPVVPPETRREDEPPPTL